MSLKDNPAIALVMESVDTLVADSEQKRLEKRDDQQLASKNLREDEQLADKRTFGMLQDVMDNPDVYTENSVRTAFDLYSQRINTKDPNLRNLEGFTPQLRPQSTDEVELPIDPKIATALNLNPETKWTRSERSLLTKRYESERFGKEKFVETKRHNLEIEKKKPGGGFFITIGGKKVPADPIISRVEEFGKTADKLFLTGYTGEAHGETGKKKVSREVYQTYKTRIDEFMKALTRDQVTPEMLQDIDELQPFIVDEAETLDFEATQDSILGGSGDRTKLLQQILELKQ